MNRFQTKPFIGRQKNDLKPWRKAQWCIATVGSDFVWPMADVLDLYAEVYDPRYPCFDEGPVQLLGDVLALRAGQPRRYDLDYVRKGTANLFVMCQPLTGWREVKATHHRKKTDFAVWMSFTSLMPSASGWFWTISTATHLPHCTRPSRLMKRGAFCKSWNSTTPLIMAPGSTWLKLKSLLWRDNASVV